MADFQNFQAFNSGQSLLGGFIQGMAQGKMEKMKMAKDDEELKLKKDALKAEQRYKESMLEMTARGLAVKEKTLAEKFKELMELFGGVVQPQQVPLPEYQPGQGMPPFAPGATMTLPQQIAQGQMGGGLKGLGLSVEDLLRGVIKKETGAEPSMYHRTVPVIMPDGNPGTAPMNEMGFIDINKAVPAPFKQEMQRGVGEGMAPFETPVNPYTRQPMGAPIQTGPPPTMPIETPTSGGGKVKSVVPLFPGGSKVTGMSLGGVRTELDLVDVPIPPTDITKWSDGAGNNPPAGWTPRQAQARGFKLTPEGMAAESGGKAVMVAQALQDIEAAEKMFFPTQGGFNRSLAISAQMGLPEWMAEGSQTAVSMMMNAAAAKLRIETGATARPEEQKDVIARFVPSWKDNEKSARGKMARFKEFMRAGKFTLDPKGRIVVIEPMKGTKKPGLSLGNKKDPSTMTNEELLKALK